MDNLIYNESGFCGEGWSLICTVDSYYIIDHLSNHPEPHKQHFPGTSNLYHQQTNLYILNHHHHRRDHQPASPPPPTSTVPHHSTAPNHQCTSQQQQQCVISSVCKFSCIDQKKNRNWTEPNWMQPDHQLQLPTLEGGWVVGCLNSKIIENCSKTSCNQLQPVFSQYIMYYICSWHYRH